VKKKPKPIAANFLRMLSRTRLPRLDGELRLAGLAKPVRMLRDDWGVPHIYAENLHDLFFAQGFAHAQDRLWQMEFNRRLVAGRLAEILGPIAVDLDRWVRTLTMRRVAEFEVNLLSEEARKLLQAYANGVNLCMLRQRLPIEFTLLRYRPEPWILADTLSWIKMMSWSLSVNWEAELLRAQLVARLGPEQAAELEPGQLKRWPNILPPGLDYTKVGAAALEKAELARPFTGPSPYNGLGSNNWVLSGERATSGKPILANDMHLQLTAPAVWYENHLCAGDIDVTGVTFSGIPGVISGHNGHVAWGFTNGFPDVQDLYIERLRQTETGAIQAEYNGVWENVRRLQETIRIKGEQPVVEDVIITRHGPIINSLAADLAGEEPLALRWTSLEPDTMAHAIFAILKAQNCAEFHQALREWTAPVQNVVYSDTEGSIAYTFPGKIPLRARSSGRLPVPGWSDEYEWIGYVPFNSLPHFNNPDQGYIASANNRVFPDDYPFPIELEPISGDRAQRIAEMILDGGLRSGQEKIDLEFIKKMQFDQVSASARVIQRHLIQVPLSISVHTPETDLHDALKVLKDWNGSLAVDSTAAAIYEVFIHKIIRLILADKLDPKETGNRSPKTRSGKIRLTERFMGKGPTPLLAEIGLFAERWLPWLQEILADPDSHWFDLGHGENRDDVIRLALQAAIDELKTGLGADMQKWSWGRLHKCTFIHCLGSQPVTAALFNRGPYPTGGDSTTLWAAGAGYEEYVLPASRKSSPGRAKKTPPPARTQLIGPAYRMIVDLGNLRNSVSLLAPGQSGNPASPHYDDQVTAWYRAGYHPMLYDLKDVEQHAIHRLILTP
jgi:penicillin amidase